MEKQSKIVGAALAALGAFGLALLSWGDRSRRRGFRTLQDGIEEILIRMREAGIPMTAVVGEGGPRGTELVLLSSGGTQELPDRLSRMGNEKFAAQLGTQIARALRSLRAGRWKLVYLKDNKFLLLLEDDALYNTSVPNDMRSSVLRIVSGPGRQDIRAASAIGSRSNPSKVDPASRWRLILGEMAKENLPPPPPNGNGGGGEEGEKKKGKGKGKEGEGQEPRRGPPTEQEIEDALKPVYGPGSMDPSSPVLHKWLGDIRRYWDKDVVAMIQKDAIEKKGLKKILFEKESLEHLVPTPEMVATLLQLKDSVPEESKETARLVVAKVVEEIVRVLKVAMEQAVRGALMRMRHQPIPTMQSLDWKRTIEANLKTWDQQRQMLIPERVYFHAHEQRKRVWNIIVAIDESGSMASSAIYSAVMACILASIPAVKVSVVVFDTAVLDLSGMTSDPVEMLFQLFGSQLGGGTDITQALQYCEKLIEEPNKTLLFLISDLMENATTNEQVRSVAKSIVEKGVRMLAMTGLTQEGQVSYDHEQAQHFLSIGIPVFACTPAILPRVIEVALSGGDVSALLAELEASGVQRPI